MLILTLRMLTPSRLRCRAGLGELRAVFAALTQHAAREPLRAFAASDGWSGRRRTHRSVVARPRGQRRGRGAAAAEPCAAHAELGLPPLDAAAARSHRDGGARNAARRCRAAAEREREIDERETRKLTQ